MSSSNTSPPEATAVAVYEVVLRFPDRDELRLTDRPLMVGGNVTIGGSEWTVQSFEDDDGLRAARYICVELRARSTELRGLSSDLPTQSH